MRSSKLLLATLRENPSDAEVISHQLMLRAGMIRKLAAGLYTWLPLGLRAFRKVEKIVREEMDRSGAQEVLMPVVQPAELWEESKRYVLYGPELCRFKDRHDRPFVLGPTHEEVITDLIRQNVFSYKQLPANFYQIQTKFRDEIRPRFGLMRAREFTMKDAYSFHMTQECLQKTYDLMHETYCRIFTRLGLDFRPVQADTGSIGGTGSHEFHVLAESGEDYIAFSNESDFAANIEKAEAVAPATPRPAANAALQLVDTPTQKTIEEVCELLKIAAAQTLKTLIVHANKSAEDKTQPLIALMLRGDHSLNEIKAEKLEGVASPLTMASDEEIRAIGCATGFIGPVGLTIPMIVDRSAAVLADFVSGANQTGKHYIGTNWERDAALTRIEDIRNVLAGDPSPDGKGTIIIKKGIEVGHIFQLGTKYSEALNATVLNEQGKAHTMIMGCYGIGVSRVVAAAIEQNNDANGIIWPDAIAPYHIALVPMMAHKSVRVAETTEKLYTELQQAGFDVLMDDRNERPGVKFADMELIGIPHRVVIGDKGLENAQVEYKGRRDEASQMINLDQLIAFLKTRVKI